MVVYEFIRRYGFSFALVASLAIHSGIAFCAFQNGNEDAKVAPFRRGRTTVSLRPTIVEPPDSVDDADEAPPELEPTVDDARSTRRFVSARRVDSTAALPLPTLPPPDSEALEAVDRFERAVEEQPAAKLAQPARRREVDIAQLDEVLQPLLSRHREGGKDDTEASVHTQPSPPFPPHLRREPVRLRLDYTIDTEGRFRDVRVASGSVESDALIARFIEQRWRAAPASRFGRPISKTYVGYLNFN
jgi:hypothetical protein